MWGGEKGKPHPIAERVGPGTLCGGIGGCLGVPQLLVNPLYFTSPVSEPVLTVTAPGCSTRLAPFSLELIGLPAELRQLGYFESVPTIAATLQNWEPGS